MDYGQSEPDIAFPASTFIEARLRFVSGSSSSTNRAAAGIVFTTAPGVGTSLYIGQDVIFLIAAGDVRGATANVDTNDAFHTYRINIDAGGAVTVLYDGVPTLTGSTVTGAGHGSVRGIFWGDVTILAAGTSDWEFVRHNASECKPCVAAPSGLVSWWPGDGNANDIQDGNHGTPQNGATFAGGRVGQAFSFDGTNDYVDVPENGGLDLDFATVEMWIKPTMATSDATGKHFIDKRTPGAVNDAEFTALLRGNGDLDVSFYTTGGHPFFNGATGLIPMNVWSHLAFTWDGTTLRVYRNGQVIGTAPGSGAIAKNSASLKIGARSDLAGPQFFKGLIDEVSIYNRPLSAAEIQAIFNAGSSGKCENVAPDAVNDTVATNEDTAAAVSVLANDTDPNGDPLTVTGVTQGSNGSVVNHGDGTVTYSPNANFNGTDSFAYTVSDGRGGTDTATVTVTVTAVNDQPDALNDTATTNEDTAVTIPVLANDTDVDGDTLTVSGVTQPANGTVTINGNGTLTYTPNANFNGTDSFGYLISDGKGGSDSATVTVTVTLVNDPPNAANDTATTPEDTAVDIAVRANDTDADGDTLSVTSVTQGSKGSVTVNANGTVKYTPNANSNGTDSFTYTISDGNGGAATATVTVTVTPVNDPPTADGQSIITDEDTAKAITLTASDVEGDALTYTIVTPPAHGSLSGTAPNLTYTPALNYNGPDSLTFKANDGTVDGNIATISITINAVNDPPVAANDSYSTDEDTTLTVTAPGVLGNDIDVDNSTLTTVPVSGPTQGTLSLNANGSFTYTPAANFNGSDSFTYKAGDGTADSNLATVSITVNPVNDPPAAVSDTETTAEDTAVDIAVLANDTDVEGDTLTVTSVTQGSKGSATINANGTVKYTPNANSNGTDAFTYTVSDGRGGTATATVTVTVTPVNDSPAAANDSYSTDEEMTLTVAAPGVLANDSDIEGDSLTVALVSNTSKGTLTLNADGSFTYTPNANFNGTDSFSYKAKDPSNAESGVATVAITVIAVNDPPTADGQSVTTDEDTAKAIILTAVDVDSNSLTYTIVTPPAHGSLSGTAPNLTYTPALNYNGPDSFTFKVNDGTVDSNTATVQITVSAVNDSPVAANDSYSTNEETTLTVTAPGVLANDSDVDGNPLTAMLVSGPAPAVGALTLNPNGSFTYAPAANFNGPVSFTYKASDGSLNSNVATVTIMVSAANDPPVANNDSYSTNEDTTLTVVAPGVLGNDSDVDSNALTAILVTGPPNGTLTLNANGSFTYAPNANFNGNDSFTYRASDGAASSNTATVTIVVNPVDDPPSWSPTGNLNTGRTGHTATRLPNGKVLVAGGVSNSGAVLNGAELYDPATGTWTNTGSLAKGRAGHTATLLANGKVLVAGGQGTSGRLNSAELYDPAVGTWGATGNLATARALHTATLLENGKLLVAGGTGADGSSLNRAELYNPVTGTWSATGNLNRARTAHTATLLPNGKVLVAGGVGTSITPLNGAELYDPAGNGGLGSWGVTGNLNTGRTAHTATLLQNGLVLIAGGLGAQGSLRSAELYNPATGIWGATGNLNTGRTAQTATLLPNGKVLIVGGSGSGSISLKSAELYDPGAGTWSATANLNAGRTAHTATLLANGQVLATGGTGPNGSLNSAELYGPL